MILIKEFLSVLNDKSLSKDSKNIIVDEFNKVDGRLVGEEEEAMNFSEFSSRYEDYAVYNFSPVYIEDIDGVGIRVTVTKVFNI